MMQINVQSKLRAARRTRKMLNKTLSKPEDKTEWTVYPPGAQLLRNAIKRLGSKREATNEEEQNSIDFKNSLASTCTPSDLLAAKALNEGGGLKTYVTTLQSYVQSKLRAARCRRKVLNKTLSKPEDGTKWTVYPAGAQLQKDAIRRLGSKREATNEEERSSIDFKNSLASTCTPSDLLAAKALNEGGGLKT